MFAQLEKILSDHQEKVAQAIHKCNSNDEFKKMLWGINQTSKKSVMEIVWKLTENSIEAIICNEEDYKTYVSLKDEASGKTVGDFIEMAVKFNKDCFAFDILVSVSGFLEMKRKGVLIYDLKKVIQDIQTYCIEFINLCNEGKEDTKVIKEVLDNYKAIYIENLKRATS